MNSCFPILLALFPRDSFFDVIRPELLYTISIVFGGITVVFVSLIYLHLYRKKRRFFLQKSVLEKLDVWISAALLEDWDVTHTHIPPELIGEFEDSVKRQWVIDRLISIKRNLEGQAAANIVRLYEQLELRNDSLKKLRSDAWPQKAKGIYELYMMEQPQFRDEIFQYTNSSNQFIRTESQTAVISFLGFGGLKFLSTLIYPITEWQQFKILQQLKNFDPEDMPDLPDWMRSENDYVVLFALRLAEVYYQLQAHDEVMHCLKSNNERIRKQAAVTLARLANDSTASLLASEYYFETIPNKRNILQQLAKIADDREASFFEKCIEEDDDLLKLEAARALARTCSNGWEIIAARATVQPKPYSDIYAHVKQELSR